MQVVIRLIILIESGTSPIES